MQITYTYPTGKITKQLRDDAEKVYAIRLDSQRPTKVEITGEPTEQFLWGSLRQGMHPCKHIIIVNGETLLDYSRKRDMQ